MKKIYHSLNLLFRPSLLFVKCCFLLTIFIGLNLQVSFGQVHNVTQSTNFTTIQAAIDDANTQNGDVITVDAGTYVEDIIVSKNLDIRGPNYNVSPNGGSRVAEAIIVPATDAVVTGEIIHVAASNVSINGFTIDGDNPSLSGGANNTNGVDMNAAEGVTVYEDNINNLSVSNNIFQNLSYFGVTLYGASFSSPASSGHVVSNNKFQNLGTYTDGTNQINFWGGGVLLYNNQYAAILDNVMSNVRIGIQTGNFSRANIGTIASQLISGNTMEVRRVGVFHNLHYSLTSPYSFTNNTITALQNANETGVRGFLLGSLSVNSTLTDNNVDLTGSTATTTGIEVWNVKSTTPSIISGGIISGVNTGIFLNNYDGYNSNATDGAYATLSGITINPNTLGTGIRLYDNPSSTHIGVEATLGAGITINNGTNGLVVENTSAKAISPTGNIAFVGQTGDYIKLINNTNNVDATAASFEGQTGATATTAQNFAIEDKIVHKIDNAALGLVRVKSAEVFVTTNSGKIQRGIDAATASDIVNVNSGTYNEQVLVNKTVSLKGSGATKPIIDFTGTVTGKPTTFDVSVDGVTIENLNFKVDLAKLRSAIIASAAGIDNITVKDNLIEPYGTPAGSYGDRNAVSINYGGSTNYRIATGGVDNISFTGNTVTFFAPVSGFRSAVAVDEGGGTFSGNTLQTINHDAIIRFGSNGDINVTNNNFNGGGVELAEQNAGAGTITVSDNIFDATFANFSAPGTAVLRLKNNQAMNPALVSGNTFSNHEWAVSLENYDLATFNNNSFTPLANSTTYHHITINTKSISSNSNTIVQTAIGGTLTNNTFNGSGTLGGTALSFQNHDSDAATFGTFTIGNVENENIFNTGIQNFILLDGQTGSTNASTFPTYPTTGGWPTTMAAWATNLDVRNNKFDVGTGLKLPNTFSFTERNTLETLLTHKPDNAALGTISYFDPVHNLTQDTYYATIQAAVTAANANDIIQLAESTYNERVTISKSLTIQGVDKANCIVSGSGLAGFGSGFYINNGVTGVTIKDLTIQNFTGNGPNGNAGVYAIGGNNNLTVKNTIIKDNVGGSGIYANGPINTVLFDGNTISGHTNVSGAARGIVIWNGIKENITITNNEVFNNNCCGIELQEGSGTNVNVSDNNIHDNGDNGIGLIGLTGPGENTVTNNIVTNNGRFGIEIKNPNGSGASTGAGKIVISNNNITRTNPIGSEVRDIAGIAVHRRAVLSGNVDVPYGTVVSGNTVSGYTQPSNSDGFGIVMEGINHTVSGNTVSGNDVGIQRQAGHSGYPGDGDQSNLADTYFGRGNSPVTCGINLTGNILSSNTIDTRDVGNSAGQGIVVNTTTGKSFCSIQTAVNDVATVNGHTLTLSSGTYNEQVLINKSLIILGVGTTKPIIDFTGTPALASGKLTAFEITVPNVTIDNLEFKMDVSKIGSAIVASVALPGSVSNLKIQNNDIDPYRSSASTVAFGSRNAVNINYGSFRINTSNPTGILAQNNTISYDNGVDTTPGTTDDAGFRSGFAMDEGTGDFTGNTIQTISQDIEVRFTNSTNNINITNNNINGGGLNYAAPNVTGGTLNITGNTFDGTFGNTYSSSIRIRDNIAPNTINTVIENNTFNNHSWGISLENYGNVSVNNNTFTPLAGLTSYHHITVNTKENASSSATVGQTAIGGVFTNNIFNGSGVAGGFGMKFLNHDNNNASYGTITLGSVGNENTFNTGITNFIAFDSQTGSSNGSTFPIYPTTGDWPTTMACWNQNINIENNKFDVGSGLELPSAMNFTSRTNLESALIHKPDNSCLGSLIYFYPVKNLTQNTTFLTIQPAITAAVANDVIELSEWTFAEGITIDKPLTIQGVDSANVVLDGASIANANGITLANNIQNITIKNLKIKNFKGSGSVGSGIFGLQNSSLSIDKVVLDNNQGRGGIYLGALAGIQNVSITNSISKNHAVAGSRGIVIWDGFKQNITITGNKVYSNNCCGIELQDGTASGVTITDNLITANVDNGLGLTGLTSGAGANLIQNNTLINNGRFGIEIKLPNGTGATSGDGSIVVEDNTVQQTMAFNLLRPTEVRDIAGIAAFRRGYVSSYGNVDIPKGVVIRNNTVSGYAQNNPSSSSTGFGIVIEGTDHTVTGNTLNNNNVGIQQQSGHLPYIANTGTDGDQSNLADLYFGRGNSPLICNNVISSNTFSGSTIIDARNIRNGAVVTEDITPTIDAVSSQVICNGSSTTLVSFTGNTITGKTYSWTNSEPSIGLAASGTGDISAFTVTNTTTVAVTATVTVTPMANGCSGTPTSFTITVNPSPVISAGSNIPLCVGSTLVLNATGGSSYSWSGPNSFSSSIASPSISNTTTDNEGVYTVTVTDDNSCTASATTNVTFNPLPTASIVTNSPVCSGNNVTFTLTTNGTSYIWSGPNSFSSTLQNPTISTATVAFSGIFSVTVTDANSCSITATTNVVVNPLPNPMASSNSPVCAEGTLNLTSSNGTSYIWSGPNSFSSTLQNPSIPLVTSAANGTYTITATDDNGCSATSTTAVVINPKPSKPLILPSSATICEGTNVTLVAVCPGMTLIWSNGATGSAIVVSPTVTTPYTVICTNTFGCSSEPSDAATVNIIAKPAPPTLAPSLSTICVGNSTILTASGCTGTVTWTDGLTGTSISVSPTVNKSYTATCTSIFGCISNSSAAISIVVNQAPTAPTLTNKLISSGASTTLTATCATGTPVWYSSASATTSLGTSTYTTPALVVNTTYYVACESNPAGSSTSNPQNCVSTRTPQVVSIDVFSIVTHPEAIYVCTGQNAYFTIGATGASITFQWQENTGSGWNNLSNGGIYSGATTSQLNITPSSATMDNYQYRCIITNTYPGALAPLTLTSNTGLLIVKTSALANNLIMVSPLVGITNLYQAVQTITATNKISGASKIDYFAGNAITLNPGFEVSAGNVFKAQIQVPCINTSAPIPDTLKK